MPNTPVVMRLTSTAKAFIFFTLALNIYKTISGNAGSMMIPVKVNSTVNDQINFIFLKKTSNVPERISISETQLNVLSIYIGAICKLLLSQHAEYIKWMCVEKIEGLNENWDKQFLNDTHAIFSFYKEHCVHLPYFTQVLQQLSLHHS